PAVPGHPVPACKPQDPQADETPGLRRQDPGAYQEVARTVPGPDHPFDLHCRLPGRNRGGLPVPPGLADRSAA
nr:hypothetical protein [Tanacetum cinerariifolium]